jgi:hypothetical protein
MEEPSVLDYLKSRLFFWREERIEIPFQASEPEDYPQTPSFEEPAVQDEVPDEDSQRGPLFQPGSGKVAARLLAALTLVLLAQRSLEPPGRSAEIGAVLYLIGVGLILWSHFRGDWRLPEKPVIEKKNPSLRYKPAALWISLPLALIAFILFGGNRFTAGNLLIWSLAVAAFVYSVWMPNSPSLWDRVRAALKKFSYRGITFTPWTLLVMFVFGLTAFFRFYKLDQVPAEMFSDHAEKLLDVANVLDGQTSIFFPRNTGREAIQMYLTAFVGRAFNTGLSFVSLKLGTAILGLLTLPFIYLLGREIANRRVGLLGMFFAGIAYWPNVISRVALRFTLYPTFTAPLLYFLIRGLRQRKRNDFILAGLFLGLGLHGYSPYRFVPILVVVITAIFLLHRQAEGSRRFAVVGFLLVALTSLLIFLPLLRFMVSNPEIFNYRMMTRMGQLERSFSAPPIQILFENLWKAMIMFVWDNGQIWVHSVPNRPALGIVSAALSVIGVVMLTARYIKDKNWLDIALLVSIPLLLMPSVLSLAFPEENPSLNRTSGAVVVIFPIAAMAVDGLLSSLRSIRLAPTGRWLAWITAGMLLWWSASQNYDLVFNQYAKQFRNNAWNTSELGAVIRQFADSYGDEDHAWVVPYPHWVDTRLVGIRAGVPLKDYALWPENIIDTVDEPGAKLYLVKPEDNESIQLLEMYYPNGVNRLYESQADGRDFYMFTVPPKR